MSKELKKYISIGFGLTALAVILGAFGAHALEDKITPHYLDVYETGNKYHFIHSVGMVIALFILEKANQGRGLRLVFLCFFTGIILFSGSLYVLSLADYFNTPGLKMLGAITPIGGVLFIVAWSYSAFLLMKPNSN